MKKTLSLLALVALVAVPFTACNTELGIDSPDKKGSWNQVSGVLTARYPKNTMDEVFLATLKGLDGLNYFRTGENSPDEKKKTTRYVVFARDVGDVKVTVDIYTKKDPKNQTEWTQVDIAYGAFGNLGKSQIIVSEITKNL